MFLRTQRIEIFLITGIAAALAAVTLWLAAHTGVTIDEPSHLLTAHLYWQGRDNLEPMDMPPLIKIAGGWIPGLAGIRLPAPDHPCWKKQHEWDASLEMMQVLNREETQRLFFWSRTPFCLFPVGCCVLLWWWGRQLFSPAAGLLAALMLALLPSASGHGALFKNDWAAAFALLFLAYRSWAYWRGPAPATSALLACALLLAVISKISLWVFLPLVVALFVAGLFRMPKDKLAAAALFVLVFYGGVLAAWRFETGRPAQQKLDWWRANPKVPDRLVTFVEYASRIPTPLQVWLGGVSIVESSHERERHYLLGRVEEGANPWYFLVAWAVKLPHGLQLLLLFGLGYWGWLFLRRGRPGTDLFWLLPGLTYFALASMSPLQLGARLVIPSLPPLLLAAGAGAAWLWMQRRWRPIPLLLLGWMAFRLYTIHPHQLSFFNTFSGGPLKGLDYLSDSNIDWGQGLPALRAWTDHARPGKFRLSYFGPDNPYKYFTEAEIEVVAPPWSDDLAKGAKLRPVPGLHAVSATLLTGQWFAEKYRGYYEDLRRRKPVGHAGYSILIYRVEEQPARP